MKDTSEGGKTTWKRLFLYGIFPSYDEMKLVSGVSVQPNGCTGTFLFSGKMFVTWCDANENWEVVLGGNAGFDKEMRQE